MVSSFRSLGQDQSKDSPGCKNELSEFGKKWRMFEFHEVYKAVFDEDLFEESSDLELRIEGTDSDESDCESESLIRWKQRRLN